MKFEKEILMKKILNLAGQNNITRRYNNKITKSYKSKYKL